MVPEASVEDIIVISMLNEMLRWGGDLLPYFGRNHYGIIVLGCRALGASITAALYSLLS